MSYGITVARGIRFEKRIGLFNGPHLAKCMLLHNLRVPGLKAVCQQFGSEVGLAQHSTARLSFTCFPELGQCEPLGTLERVRSIWGDFQATLPLYPDHFGAFEDCRAEKKSLSRLNMTTCFLRPLSR